MRAAMINNTPSTWLFNTLPAFQWLNEGKSERQARFRGRKTEFARQGHIDAYRYNAEEEFSTPIRNESRSLSLCFVPRPYLESKCFLPFLERERKIENLSHSLPSQRSPLLHFRIYICIFFIDAWSIVCTTFAKPFTSSSASGGYILPGNRTATRVISHPLSRRATHRDTRRCRTRGSWEIYAACFTCRFFLNPFGSKSEAVSCQFSQLRDLILSDILEHECTNLYTRSSIYASLFSREKIITLFTF